MKKYLLILSFFLIFGFSLAQTVQVDPQLLNQLIDILQKLVQANTQSQSQPSVNNLNNNESITQFLPDENREDDVIVQLNNLRITRIAENPTQDAKAVFFAVRDTGWRCMMYESEESRSSRNCPLSLKRSIISREIAIKITNDTILLLRNRQRTQLSNFQIGDKINVYGFMDKNNYGIEALIVRKISITTTTKPSQSNKISYDVFKNAIYRIPYVSYDGFKMIDGSAKLAKYTICFIVNPNSKKILNATIDQNRNRGVVTVYCNYGASGTDVFLVAFKNLNSVPVQTDVVDLRQHPDLVSRNLFRVDVRQMSLENSLLKVIALVVPDYLRNAPGSEQSATEPVTISYILNDKGKLITPTSQPSTSQPSIRIISPNGGEVWEVGKTYTIRWNTIGFPSTSRVQITLRDTRYSSEIGLGEALIVNTVNSGSYTWSIPSQLGSMILGDGNVYKVIIHIDEGGSGKYNISDDYFSIVSATPTVRSIKVLSPNGGESLVSGQTYRIRWTGGNNNVDIYLLDNPTRLGKKIFSGIANSSYVDWTVTPLTSNDLYDGKAELYRMPSGQYVILIGCSDGNCTVDTSDAPFSIVNP
jgi:hypothetical protein